jgi:CSLREA domain-containing protein/uncharacterized repeat protein (TIGR01451 family)
MSTKSLGSLLRITFALVLTLGSLTLLHPPSAYAANTLTVTKVADTNDGTCNTDCSLREAIAVAASGDMIVFASSLAGQTVTLGSQLDIARDLTIDGSSLSTHVQISGNHTVRVFYVNSGTNVNLTHLDILNGYTTSDYGGYGGGIYNDGTLTVQNSTLSGNSSDTGGGISSNGTLTVQGSTLSGNSANYGGGGISSNGTLTVQNSTISGNSATDNYIEYAGEGGGIRNSGTLTVQNSTFSGNSGDEGGGIANYGTLTVQNSTISGNLANYAGGISNDGTLTVQNSTLSGNSAFFGGGGISNYGTLTVQNSTLSNNSAYYSGDSGGGIYNGGTLNYENTIIANSYDVDCYNDGTIVVNNHNLVEDGSCNSALLGDPLLGPLADNGGDAWTQALLPGSPAIDAGDDAVCLATDQRGVPRPQGAHCDIGAYEIGPFRLDKTAEPATDVPYHGLVTYTIVLNNTSGDDDPNVSLVDTLPAEVTFDSWVASPANTSLTGDEIRWNGALNAGQAVTWKFQVRHTGDYGDHVTNLAHFSGTLDRGIGQGSFDVECLPIYSVQNANDNGAGSLRQAIANVCPGGRIVFSGDFSIYLGSELAIARNLTIDGEDHTITVSGNRAVRVFNIATGSLVTLSHLDIVSGYVYNDRGGNDRGGGVFNNGTLTIQNCTLSGNSGHSGGGIYNHGTLTVQDSTLSGNSTTENDIRNDSNGGGIYNNGTLKMQNSTISHNSAEYLGGGIANYGTLTVQDSTISHNSAAANRATNGKTSGQGGGIYNDGTLTMQNSTLSNNSSAFGGGIANNDTLTLQNSTLSGNSAFFSGGIKNSGTLNYENTIIANSYDGDCYHGTSIVYNHNLVEDGSCSDNGINFFTGDPLLGPLTNNGGDTWTQALLPGSPAIDAGDDATCLPTDQRGVPRPQGAHCDIGAYEYEFGGTNFFIYLPLVRR